jgi:hypothetical protein
MDGGNIYSQGGKSIFPAWEYFVPSKGRNDRHVIEKERHVIAE